MVFFGGDIELNVILMDSLRRKLGSWKYGRDGKREWIVQICTLNERVPLRSSFVYFNLKRV